MQSSYKQKADTFHIIGHSLGAHIAGDAGSRLHGLGRITGKLAAVLTLIYLHSITHINSDIPWSFP